MTKLRSVFEAATASDIKDVHRSGSVHSSARGSPRGWSREPCGFFLDIEMATIILWKWEIGDSWSSTRAKRSDYSVD